MEFWRYSPVLRNDIREHQRHEKNIIENARQAIQAVSKLYVINSIDDVLNALKKIYEHDTFGYDTDLNSANGMMLKIICEAINKYKETDYELRARCNDEELTFKDNQEKEDKILYRLNSIDEHIVQGNEKKEADKQTDQNDPSLKQGGYNYEQELFNLFPIFQKHSEFLKDKGYYEIDGNNLRWAHGGNLLLAGYFGGIQDVPGNPRLSWVEVEKAFNTRNLAPFYNDYKSLNKGKTVKHEKYDKELRNLIAGKISL